MLIYGRRNFRKEYIKMKIQIEKPKWLIHRFGVSGEWIVKCPICGYDYLIYEMDKPIPEEEECPKCNTNLS